MNYFTDSSEWKYLFHQAIDWETILPLYYKKFPTSDGFENSTDLISFYEELLTSTGKWTSEVIEPRAEKLDQIGGGKLKNHQVQITEILQKTYQEAKEMDIFGVTMHPEFGGMGLPLTVGFLIFEQLCRACVSTATQIGFFTSIADMIERFCNSETQLKLLPKIKAGELSGSMCLTEPNAGSDVGALRTSAQLQNDGTYRLNGTKCFITNGGGGLGFILARIEGAPQGLNGISMFLAEEWIEDPQTSARRQNYKISKIEEKMGMHGSPTCEIVYENTVAKLVGKKNEGFKLMLHLMNEARISVGMQGLGGIEAALSASRKYAETRTQFGKPIIELPLLKRNIQDWETEQDAFRVLMVDTISYYDIFQRLDIKQKQTGDLNQEQTKLYQKVKKIVRRRTPLVKYYGAETNTTLTQRAIQVFGGYGYMTEYGVERLHRDSFGALLYEGTSQIQALMAMKDFVKGMIDRPRNFIQSLVVSHPIGSFRVESEFQRSINSVRYEFRKNVAILMIRCFKPELNLSERSFKEVIAQINQTFKKDYWLETGRLEKLMVHAETLCQALAYQETLRILSKHATLDSSRGDLYYRYLKLVNPRLTAIYTDWKSQ